MAFLLFETLKGWRGSERAEGDENSDNEDPVVVELDELLSIKDKSAFDQTREAPMCSLNLKSVSVYCHQGFWTI